MGGARVRVLQGKGHPFPWPVIVPVRKDVAREALVPRIPRQFKAHCREDVLYEERAVTETIPAAPTVLLAEHLEGLPYDVPARVGQVSLVDVGSLVHVCLFPLKDAPWAPHRETDCPRRLAALFGLKIEHPAHRGLSGERLHRPLIVYPHLAARYNSERPAVIVEHVFTLSERDPAPPCPP